MRRAALPAEVDRLRHLIVLGGFSPTPPSAGPVAKYVDPSNITGKANDSNDGQTPDTPILTTLEQNSRIAAHPNLTADLNMVYMSDDLSGTGLYLEPLSQQTFNIVISGTVQIVHQGGTFTSGTVEINPVGNQRQVIHTSDVADWTSYVVPNGGGTATNLLRIVDESSGATAWTAGVGTSISGGDLQNLSATRPLLDDGTPGSFVIGDTYQLTRGSILTIGESDAPQSAGGTLAIVDFQFTPDSVGPSGENIIVDRCGFLGPMQMSGAEITNSAFFGILVSGITFISGGLWISATSTTGNILVTLDTYVTNRTGEGLVIGGPAANYISVSTVDGDNGLQVQDCSGVNRAGILLESSSFQSSGIVWGSGNQGHGIVVYPGVNVWLTQSTTAPIITGAAGDFAFFNTTGPLTNDIVLIDVARAWDDSTGAYTESGGPATRATTWSNLVAAIGSGGLDGQAHCLQTSSSLIITGGRE